ncbi:T9SS type A sorting domain-containing protein, partial [candidate division KSB1 bacterium]|nr:T9SS type A sorting domain-containing protein [candidate division KSB1 bacterium]
DFAALWYPGKIDSSEARALEVLENLTGIYFYLNAVAVGSINENFMAPETYIFKQNYPNPFNPLTQIQFGLPQKEFVEILVYDIQGRLVKCLQQGEMPAGWHTIRWDATDSFGNLVTSGIYLTALKAGNQIWVQKMLLLK